MRQLADKANGIRQQHFLCLGNAQLARGRVKRIKQSVVCLNACIRQCIEQRRFSGVGIADNRNQRQFRLLSLSALHGANAAHILEVAAQLVNALPDVPAVGFQLGFARASCADAAAQPRHALAHTGQARQDILILRQLDLQLALAGARALCENIQNQRASIQHRSAGCLLQHAHLRRRKFVVKHNQCCIVVARQRDKFLQLALADKGVCVRRISRL